jgi:hypothetical protein
MMAWGVLALALAYGWFQARRLTMWAWGGPRWAAEVGTASLAVLFGVGLASVAGFALFALRWAAPLSIYAVLSLLTVFAIWQARRVEPRAQTPGERRFPWIWALVAALSAACVLLMLDFQTATQANPDGDWDATAIWNLRARYLAGGAETWRRAISAEIGARMTGAAHPGYPLFLSSFLAMQWIAAGSATPAAPAVLSLLFSLSLVGLLVAALARRSPALGLLAGVVLIGTELMMSQVSAQYADIPLALAFLSCVVLLDAGAEGGGGFTLLAAGLAIGFAPWIKNEGMPFAIAALAVAWWRFKFRALWVILGSLPGLIAVAALKLMAEGREVMFPTTMAELFSKLATPSRWIQSLAGFGKGILDAGPWWAHPVLLVLALALVLRFIPAAERRARIWLAVPIAGALAAEYGIFLVTANDLAWHLSTSVERLLAQVWPSLLYLILSMMRAPEEYFDPPPELVPVAVPRGGPNKRKRTSA